MEGSKRTTCSLWAGSRALHERPYIAFSLSHFSHFSLSHKNARGANSRRQRCQTRCRDIAMDAATVLKTALLVPIQTNFENETGTHHKRDDTHNLGRYLCRAAGKSACWDTSDVRSVRSVQQGASAKPQRESRPGPGHCRANLTHGRHTTNPQPAYNVCG